MECPGGTGTAARGFTVVEILIALAVVSFGLLSLGLMQGKAVRSVNDAFQRSQATALAAAIVERMRANDPALLSRYVGQVGHAITPAIANPGSVNSAAQRVQADLYEWQQSLASSGGRAGLYQAVGTITKNGAIYTVTITWQSNTQLAEGAASTIRTAAFSTQF
ncbi:MAG: type IV pilus modification protein PilV [Magnetococcales bacterium]|nr:type IV pilus modification protein PilV [Magnetococcales bacterium]